MPTLAFTKSADHDTAKCRGYRVEFFVSGGSMLGEIDLKKPVPSGDTISVDVSRVLDYFPSGNIICRVCAYGPDGDGTFSAWSGAYAWANTCEAPAAPGVPGGAYDGTVSLAGGGTVYDLSGQQANFTINLSKIAPGDVLVDYATANGTAIGGVDYTTTQGTKTIAAPAVQGSVAVPIIERSGEQGTRDFSLNISNARHGETGLTIITPSKTATIVEGAAKALLQPSDFTYLGAFSLPQYNLPEHPGFTTLSVTGMTVRWVNGRLRVLVIAEQSGYFGYSLLLEYETADLSALLRTSAPYNPMPLLGSPGEPSLGKCYDSGENVQWNVIGCHWDEEAQRLFWTTWRDYGACNYPLTIGYTTMNTPAVGVVSTLGTSTGPWRMGSPTLGGCRFIKDWKRIPDWYVQSVPYLRDNNLKWLAGFGGVMSQMATGPTHVGFAAAAFQAPDPMREEPHTRTVDDSKGYYAGPRKNLIEHPWHVDTKGTRPLFTRRGDADYYSWAAAGYWNPAIPGSDETGYFVNDDHQWGQGCWVDTPTKSGLIMFPRPIWGMGQKTVLANPVPTLSSFALDDVTGLMVGDRFIIDNDIHRPCINHSNIGNSTFGRAVGYHTCPYGGDPTQGWGEDRRIKAIDGNVITFESPLGYTTAAPNVYDTHDLHKVPVAGQQFFTGEWYQDGGVYYSRAYQYWYCYDPNELTRVANNQLDTDLVDWTWRWESPLPLWPGAIQGVEYNGYPKSTAYDPVEKLLFVQADYMVSVFQVAG